MPAPLNLTGQRFGRLTVVSKHPDLAAGGQYQWNCSCDCGNTTTLPVGKLRSGNTRSCGCLLTESRITHGLSHTPEHVVWIGIKNRCYSKSDGSYQQYGGRGINMSDEWKESFEAFYRDMGPRPSDQHSVERRNNDEGYTKDNCYWATKVEQQNNTRRNVFYEYKGEKKTLAQWCRELDLDYSLVQSRLQYGWDFQSAVESPKHARILERPMIKNYLEYISLCSKMAEYHRVYHRDGVGPIPDAEYDQLRKDLIQWETDNPDKTLEISPTFKVGHIEPERRNEETRHEYPFLSLENALNKEEHDSFVKLWLAKYGPDVEIVGEFKYDGLAIGLHYLDGKFVRALTRGDGEYGEDVTKHMAGCVPETIMAEGVIEVRGEAVVSKKTLETLNLLHGNKYANARSAVCALINPNLTSVSRHNSLVTFVPYDIEGDDLIFLQYLDKLDTLKQLGFQMLSCFSMTPDKIQDCFEKITTLREAGDIPYEIDGMVFKINSLKLQLELGETTHSPRHSFAYKFPPVKAPCQLLQVVFQVGRSGEVAPVAKISATSLMGVLVTSVNLHNEDRMRERKIAIGNVYEVYRSGDVIPHLGKLIEEQEGAIEVNFPTCCPSCNSSLVKRGAIYYCENTKACPAQNAAAIAYAVSRDVLAIDGMAEQTVELMLSQGMIQCVADIFKLSAAHLEKIPGYTEYSAWKMWSAINFARKTTFDRYLMALGIPEVGKVTARSLAQRIFKRDALFDLTTPEKVLELRASDVGKVTASNIAQYFSDPVKKENARELLKILDIDEMGEVREIPGVAGKTFVFSGSFSETREVLSNRVLAAGGYVSTHVSPMTTYVVTGERSGSKVRKAKVLNIEVIDERTFLSFFENVDKEGLGVNSIVPLSPLELVSDGGFKKLDSGLYVGYHVEGCETFELAGSIPLSMATLHDDRPLFLANNDEDWFPKHLRGEDFTTYEIQFVLPKHKVFTTYAEYQEVNPGWDEKTKSYRYSEKLKKLMEEGYHMFSIGGNDKDELPESFIVHPTKYVKSIKKLEK